MLKLLLLTLCLATSVYLQSPAQCSSTQILINGNCEERQLGCIRQSANNVCLQCDVFFQLLEDGKCSGVYGATFDFGDPIVNVTDEIEQKYGSSARQAHDFNLRVSPFLRDWNLVSGGRVYSVMGTIVSLKYAKDNEQALRTTITSCLGETSLLYDTRYEAQAAQTISDPLSLIQIVMGFTDQQLFTVRSIFPNEPISSMTAVFRGVNGALTGYPLAENNPFQVKYSDITLQLVIKKLEQNKALSFNPSQPSNFTNYPEYGAAVFFYGLNSISVIFDECRFQVNNVFYFYENAKVYNEDPNFFKTLQDIKKKSQVSNLPPIKNVIVNQFVNGNVYEINYNLIDPFVQEEIPFTIKVGSQTGSEPIIIGIDIDDTPIKTTIDQVVIEAEKPAPSPQVTGQNITIPIQITPQNLIPNCLQINQFGCNLCIDNYGLVNGRCQLCSSSQEVKNKICVPKNCLEFNGDICYQCNKNYGLVNGRCEICQDHEQIFGVHCVTKYCRNAFQNTCIECIDNFGLRNNICSQCEEYQEVIDKICVPRNCQVYGNPDTCLECVEGNYELRNGNCIPCNENEQLINGVCRALPVDTFCSFEIGGSCFQCYQGFTPVPGQPRCEIPHCISYSFRFCTECESNFILINNSCFARIPGCSEYDSSGECRACELGLRLANNQCLQ